MTATKMETSQVGGWVKQFIQTQHKINQIRRESNAKEQVEGLSHYA